MEWHFLKSWNCISIYLQVIANLCIHTMEIYGHYHQVLQVSKIIGME